LPTGTYAQTVAGGDASACVDGAARGRGTFWHDARVGHPPPQPFYT